MEFANSADAVLVGSGIYTRDIAKDKGMLNRIKLDPVNQLVCSRTLGTFILSVLGILDGLPACTDLTTKPWVIEVGVEVLNQPFFARNNIATAGGCMSSQYLATWIIAKLAGNDAAESAIHYVASVG